MAWKEETARDRVNDRAKSYRASDITVTDLTRERDFSALGRQEVLRAKGVHIYADVYNFHRAVADAGADLGKQRKLIRAASTLRRMWGELVDEAGVLGVQMQSARFHGMCFKPYDGKDASNEADRVLNTVTTAISMQSYLYDVFNEQFEEVINFYGAVGIDSGEFLVANIGYHGNRSLISLGTPANVAAKVIGDSGSIRITKRCFDLLPKDLQDHFKKQDSQIAGFDVYKASGLRWKAYPELAKKLKIDFDHDKWTKRTKDYKDTLVLADMKVSEAEVLIDPEKLTEWNSKRTEAVTLYADIDGFTKCVQDAEATGKKEDIQSLVRVFHLIRAEFQSCIECDGYEGLALQHQGDCVLAIAHLPSGDDKNEKRRRRGLDIATAIQSSMEHALQDAIGSDRNLHVVVGVDVGKVIVTRLGKQGEREVVCLGPKVTSAQDLQMQSDAVQTRISESVYEAITDETTKEFFEKDDGSYVATKLTFPELEDKEDEKNAKAGTLSVKATASGVEVGRSAVGAASSSRPWMQSM